MAKRIVNSCQPMLVFTEDFHQLMRGRLERGRECSISYDPDRIVPQGDSYCFGDQNRPIYAGLQFLPNGPVHELVLESWSGVTATPSTTVTGKGPMLKGIFIIPADAAWIGIWFRFVTDSGQTRYDSNDGMNFIFRFQAEDLQILDASIVADKSGAMDLFSCRISARNVIEAIALRYRIQNSSAFRDRNEVNLKQTGEPDSDGRVLWQLAAEQIPTGATLAFDLIYTVGGRRFKDDNQGNYYIASKLLKSRTA